jgi:hypothetical protein
MPGKRCIFKILNLFRHQERPGVTGGKQWWRLYFPPANGDLFAHQLGKNDTIIVNQSEWFSVYDQPHWNLVRHVLGENVWTMSGLACMRTMSMSVLALLN